MATVLDKLNMAVELHRSGQTEKADSIYKEVLKLEPDNYNALYLQAFILYEKQCFDETYNNLLKASQGIKSPQVYKFLGDVCFDKLMLQESIDYYEKALLLEPNNYNIAYNIGVVANKNQDYEKAIMAYTKAIELKNDYTDAYLNLGCVFRTISDFENAIKCFDIVIDLDFENDAAYLDMGLTLEKKGDDEKAIIYYKEAFSLNPVNADACFKIGLFYYKNQEYKTAVDFFKNAISLNPCFVNAYNNLGLAYYYLYRIDDSIQALLTAKSFDSNNAGIYLNLGNSYKEKNDFEKAVNCYEKALELLPDYHEAKFNLGLVYLQTGEYEKGWKYFEERFYSKDNSSFYYYNDKKDLWDGKNPENKVIYIHNESGFGDDIQFSRYLHLLAGKAKKVIFNAKPELYSLFKENFDNITVIADNINDKDVDFDCYANLMSLPYLLNTKESIPFLQIPYIKAYEPRVKEFKNAFFLNDALKIGINWQCKNKFFKDKFRSLDNLKQLSGIINIKGAKIYSLQKGDAESQLDDFNNITNLSETMIDFADTASIIENLDLVITVDTAIAHLAGAMGKPTCVLLPYTPSWRWHLINDSHEYLWYKNLKVFVQNEPHNWEIPIKNCLNHVVKTFNV